MKICIELISSQNNWNTIKLLQFHKDTNSDNEKLSKVKDHECPGRGRVMDNTMKQQIKVRANN